MDPVGVWAVAGAYLLDTESSYEQEIQASALIIHKDYDEDTVINDIGMVKLVQAMKLNDKVKTIQLPPENYPINAGTAVTVAGWGEVVVSSPSNLILLILQQNWKSVSDFFLSSNGFWRISCRKAEVCQIFWWKPLFLCCPMKSAGNYMVIVKLSIQWCALVMYLVVLMRAK